VFSVLLATRLPEGWLPIYLPFPLPCPSVPIFTSVLAPTSRTGIYASPKSNPLAIRLPNVVDPMHPESAARPLSPKRSRVDEFVPLKKKHMQEINCSKAAKQVLRHSSVVPQRCESQLTHAEARDQVHGRSSEHPSPNPPRTLYLSTATLSFATAACTKHTPQV
jgi:hypothetical protein